MARHTHGGKRVPGPGKKLGRPTDGNEAKRHYSLSLSPSEMKKIDEQASRLGLTRSQAVNLAISAWLKQSDYIKNIDALDAKLTSFRNSLES
jgi:hypothetical protein